MNLSNKSLFIHRKQMRHCEKTEKLLHYYMEFDMFTLSERCIVTHEKNNSYDLHRKH
jgi:hypothetical protein